jgi:hypothetical protein
MCRDGGKEDRVDLFAVGFVCFEASAWIMSWFGGLA